MPRRSLLLMIPFLLMASASAGKKEKIVLPTIVLKAETVMVVIMPDAGEPVTDLAANRKAREEVETALIKWGRFRLALDAQTADLVIAVRKGSEMTATPTVSGGPVDSRPVTIGRTDEQIRVGGQQGHPPDLTQTGMGGADNSHPRMGTEMGPSEDAFKVYVGGVQYPLDGAPVWSYMAKDGLRPPSVRAVEEFRKVFDAAEKAAAQQQKKKTP